MVDIAKIRHIHCIGIGGIGVSALALMFKERGATVSGSDASESHSTENLRDHSISVFIGHHPELISDDIDCVLYTIACPTTDPERVVARTKNIPEISYPEMLGLISSHMKTIAVSGTHGKTTTTAMIADVVRSINLDPTVVVGSFMYDADRSNHKRNFIAGKSDYFIVEACEYRRSFLQLSPYVLIITTIDNDHLDYYKDINDIQNAFLSIMEKVPSDGAIICDPNDQYVAPVVQKFLENSYSKHPKIIDFTVYIQLLPPLQVPGEHNRRNAAAAYATASFLLEKDKSSKMTTQKNNNDLIQNSLHTFKGTWRRFEYKGLLKKGANDTPIRLYDDYAHHPTEIKATLSGAREMYPKAHIVAVFQPHLFSRTRELFDEFSKAFSDADELYIAPIYAARESFDSSITASMLAQAIALQGKKVFDAPTMNAIIEKIKNDHFSNETIIITMGAGNIYKVAEELIR